MKRKQERKEGRKKEKLKVDNEKMEENKKE